MPDFMLDSAVSSLDQALIHLRAYDNTKDDKQLRFVLIHLVGALELFIKKSLIDRGIDVFREKKPGTISLKASLGSLNRLFADIPVSEVQYLKDLLYENQIRFLIDFRNEAQHTGRIPKEQEATGIILKVLESIQAYIELFFQLQVNDLDSYLLHFGVKKDPLQLYLDDAGGAYNAGLFEVAYRKKVLAIDLIIRETRRELTMKEILEEQAMDLLKEFAELLSNPHFSKYHSSEELEQLHNYFKKITSTWYYITFGRDAERQYFEEENIDPRLNKEDIDEEWTMMDFLEEKLTKTLLTIKKEQMTNLSGLPADND